MVQLLTINTLDQNSDYRLPPIWQPALYPAPVLTSNVFDFARRVARRVGRRGAIRLLRIFGHGEPGIQRVGGGLGPVRRNQLLALNRAGELYHQTLLLLLRPYFADGAVVQLHGPAVGFGRQGRALVQELANLWGVRVQATTGWLYPDPFVAAPKPLLPGPGSSPTRPRFSLPGWDCPAAIDPMRP